MPWPYPLATDSKGPALAEITEPVPMPIQAHPMQTLFQDKPRLIAEENDT